MSIERFLRDHCPLLLIAALLNRRPNFQEYEWNMDESGNMEVH